MENSERRVLELARQAITVARFADQAYATGLRPRSTAEMAHVLRRLSCHLEVYRFPGDDGAFTIPFGDGSYTLCVNRDASRTDRALATRHELAHVLNGDSDGVVYLSDHDFRSAPERAADLFALADLIPGEWIRERKRAVWLWRDLQAEIRDFVAEFGEFWAEERVEDRAMLRVRLYRDFGI